MSDTMLTVKEAADRLGVTDARVRQIILAGQLRARKFAGSWMVDVGDLDKYIGELAQRERDKPKL